MTPTRQEDQAYMLEDAGVVVTLGATSTHGRVRHAGMDVFEGEGRDLASSTFTVLVRTGSLPGLEPGASLAVGGVAYRVREHLPESDGTLTRIHCVKEA